MPQPPRVTAPEKELRFTRSGQALWFWLATVFLVATACVILVASSGRITEPDRIHPAWAIAPIALAWASSRIAIRLTRHAYLILTPLGIEIFPFFRPAHGMQMVSWGEIADAEANPKRHRLTLHFDAAHTSGIHLSLRPIREGIRPLLIEAIAKRVRNSSESPSDN